MTSLEKCQAAWVLSTRLKEKALEEWVPKSTEEILLVDRIKSLQEQLLRISHNPEITAAQAQLKVFENTLTPEEFAVWKSKTKDRCDAANSGLSASVVNKLFSALSPKHEQ